MEILGPAPPCAPHNGRRVFARCDCGVVKSVRLRDVERGIVKSCGCRVKRSALVPVGVVPASKWMNDAVLIDALVSLLNPPHGRLPYLAPTRVSEVCAALGCESWHVLRAPISVACEWDDDGERMWGRRIAAGDLFGDQLAARLGGRRRAA